MKNAIPLMTREKEPMKYEIFTPTLDDAPIIGLMHLQSWIETYQNPSLGIDESWIRKNIGYVAEPSGTDFRKDIIQEISRGNQNIFYRIAKDSEGEIVGFVHAAKTADPNTPNKFDALYTLKRAQGQGLGQQLMEQAMDWLGSEKPIKLEVTDYNQHAIDFYRKYGYEIASEPKVWKEPMSIVEMVHP